MVEHHRQCKCAAVYRRTESMAPDRQTASFECPVGGRNVGDVEHGVGAHLSTGHRSGAATRLVGIAVGWLEAC
jgi:hypothetical protein